MALALYRKYRSATFAEVIGQEHVTGPLSQALSAGKINHAYLFSGPRGCGKTSSARILARSLNCAQGPTAVPCGVCDSCRDLAPNGPGSIDVIEIDAASHGGVDDARDLRERAYYAPARDRYKVYIIDEAHMVTTQGFNALLKLVEEPPDFLVFVFATTEPDKVLQTIRSRTHHYPFRLIPPAVLRAHLERICAAEQAMVEPPVFPLVVRAGGGSARDSLSILDQLLAGAGPEGVTYGMAVGLLGVTDSALLDDMIDSLAVGDAAGVYATIDRVVEAGHDPRRFAADLLDRFRDLMVLDAVPDAATRGLIDYPGDQVSRMTDQSRRIGAATLVRFADITHTTLTEMRGTTSPRLMLELLCARMMLPDAAADSAALLQRIERVERRQALGMPDPAAGPQSAPSPQPGASVAAKPSKTRPGRAPSPDAPSPDAPSPDAPSPDAPSPQAESPQVASAPAESPQGESAEPAPLQPVSAERPAPSVPPGAAAQSPSAPSQSAPSPSAPSPSAPSTSPGSPVAAGNADAAGLRRIWPDVLDRVKQVNKRARAMLEHASVGEVSGTVVQLAVTSPAMARMIADEKNLSVLRDALTAVVGPGWQLEVSSGGEPAAAVAVPPDPVSWDEPPPEEAPITETGASRPPAPAPATPWAPSAGEPDDGVDEESDVVSGRGAGLDPETAAMQLLQSSLGARPID